MPNRKHPSKETTDFILKHAKSSTAFLTLYSGFAYYRLDEAEYSVIIPYMEAPKVRVAASSPIISFHGHEFTAETELALAAESLIRFFEESKKLKKTCVLLPASKALASKMREKGYFAIQAGSEPWYSIKSMQDPRREILQKIHSAKHLFQKGAVAEAFIPKKLTAREHTELEALTHEWLESRKISPLKFLNRLEPWVQSEHKKYFRMIYNGRQMGYLAATPVAGRKAWYLVDLIRADHCPPGTTEFLIAEAMEQLKKEGAEEVTLGMAPLTPTLPDEFPFHPLAYRFMNYSFEKMNLFYNFKSLHAYKDKFKPTTWEPQYLIASTPSLRPTSLYGLSSVILPQGIWRTALGGFWKKIKAIQVEKTLNRMFSPNVILRRFPKSLAEMIIKAKFTLSINAINIMFFIVANDDKGNLLPRFANTYAYQWTRLVQNRFHFQSIDYFFLPSFLHFNHVHIIFNSTLLVVVVGYLEILVGSFFVGMTFTAGMLLSNLLTSIFFLPWIRLLAPTAFQLFSEELDVGASLGIFSCIAVFIYFLKCRRPVYIALALSIVVAAIYQNSVITLNHLIALVIGFGLANYFYPLSRCEALKAKVAREP